MENRVKRKREIFLPFAEWRHCDYGHSHGVEQEQSERQFRSVIRSMGRLNTLDKTAMGLEVQGHVFRKLSYLNGNSTFSRYKMLR